MIQCICCVVEAAWSSDKDVDLKSGGRGFKFLCVHLVVSR